MKQIFTLICLTTFTHVASAQLLSENFNFSGLITANGWTAHSAGGTTPITTSGVTGLTYTGYVGSGVGSTGNAAALGASGEDDNKTLSTAQTSGVVYYSFLLKVTSMGASKNNYITGLYENSTTFPMRLFLVSNAGATNFEFGIGRSGAAIATTANTYSFGATYLVVMKYEFVSGTTNDIISLFIQTSGVNINEGTPNLTYSGATGTDATSINGVLLRQGTATDAIISTIDELRVANTWTTVLPIETSNIAAQNKGTKNVITWSTASEKNNAYFEVQHATNGLDFQSISEKIKGNGTTNVKNDYTFEHLTPSVIRDYYRLRQVDTDGTATLSKVVSVVATGKNGALKVYPTLASDKLNISVDSKETVDFNIYNLVGQTVQSGQLTGQKELIISHLPSGTYILKVGNATVTFSKN